MIVFAATQAVGQDGGTPATSRTTESPDSRPGADECRREVRFVMEDGGPVPYLMVYAGSATMIPPDGVISAPGVRGREIAWHLYSGICTPRFVAATSVENGLRLGPLNVAFAPEGPPVTIRLRRFPTLRGRVVDGEGRPLMTSPMPFAVVDGAVRWSNNNLYTNADGTFEVPVEFDGRILKPDESPTAAGLLLRDAVIPLSVEQLARGGDLGTFTMRSAKVRVVDEAGAKPSRAFLVDPRAEILGAFRFPIDVDEAVADEFDVESAIYERGGIVLRAVAEGCIDEIVRIPAPSKPAETPTVTTVRLRRASADLAVRVVPWTAPVPLSVEAETADGSPLFVSSGRPGNPWEGWFETLERRDRAVASVDAGGTAHFRGVHAGKVVRLRLLDDIGPFGDVKTATTQAIGERSTVEVRLPGTPWGLQMRTMDRVGGELQVGMRALGGGDVDSGRRLTLFREFIEVQCVDLGRAIGPISRAERKTDEQVVDLVFDRGFGRPKYPVPPAFGFAMLRAVNTESRPRTVRVDFVDAASGAPAVRNYDIFEAGPLPVHFARTALPAGTYRATAYVGLEGSESSLRPRFGTTMVVRTGETTVVDVR